LLDGCLGFVEKGQSFAAAPDSRHASAIKHSQYGLASSAPVAS
jgi:hypothetical protein